MVIVEGNLDFEAIQCALHDNGFSECTWRLYEVSEAASSASLGAMAALQDESYAALRAASGLVMDVLKPITHETGFHSSDESSTQDMKRASDGTGIRVLRDVRRDRRVEPDIKGSPAITFAVNPPGSNGLTTLEATTAFLFRTERTAEPQANGMTEFYQEAIYFSPSWSPPVSLPTTEATLSTNIGGPEVDGEFAKFLVTFVVEGEGPLDDERAQIRHLTRRIANTSTALPGTSQPHKFASNIAVASTLGSRLVELASVLNMVGSQKYVPEHSSMSG